MTDDYRASLRSNLRRLRQACNFTQSELAEVLGITRSTYSYYELGSTTPSIDTLVRLAAIFHISLDAFFLPDPQTEPPSPKLRVRNHPLPDPQRIGDLSQEEKELIARLRLGIAKE